MLPVANTDIDSRFLNLFDKYSPVMYGLLLRLMATKAQAEAVLTEVFEKIYRDNLYDTNPNCMATRVLRLAVITAYKRQFDTGDFLEKVNALPRLHRLLLGNINLQTFVNEPLPNSREYGREIASELRQIAQSDKQGALVIQH